MYLSLENITKVFPPRGGTAEVTAVHDISLEIEKGELVTLLGPSGCGKTTTLRMIAGFEFPTTGKIILDGQEINALPPINVICRWFFRVTPFSRTCRFLAISLMGSMSRICPNLKSRGAWITC